MRVLLSRVIAICAVPLLVLAAYVLHLAAWVRGPKTVPRSDEAG